jgi:hypothetical protein
VDSKPSSLGSKFTLAGGISKESDVRPSGKEVLTEVSSKTFKRPAILQFVIKTPLAPLVKSTFSSKYCALIATD